MKLKQIFKKINKVSKNEKTEVYIVGGYVRDLILSVNENDITDIDFVVVGSGLEFSKKFDEEMENIGSLVEFSDFDTARYVLKVKSHPDSVGTKVKSIENKKNVEKEETIILEFAGARSEKYDSKSRKPKVTLATLEEDLKRRDFTVNAMAVPVDVFAGLKSPTLKKIREKIIDPFGGKIDLENKILRTPLQPDETFSEDPLRMLRVARFASQLNFEIEKETYLALTKNCSRLKIISAERIKEELFKLLSTKIPSVGLWILYNSGLLKEFFPEISDLYGVEEIYGIGHKNNLSHTFRVVDNVAERSKKNLLRFAALLHDIGKPGTKKFIAGRGWAFDMHEHLGKKITQQVSRRLRLSKEETVYVSKLVRWHQQPIALMDEGVTDSAVRRLIVSLGEELNDLMILCRSDITTGNPKKLEKRLKNYDYLEKRIKEVIEKDKLRAFQSPVRGEEIMELTFLKAGPTVGKIKKAIEEAILDGELPNEYEVAKKYFLKIKDKYLLEAEEWEKATNKK